MKKLMIALAVVAMAAGVQAANVAWKIQLNSAEVGNDLYVVLASSLSGKDLAKLYAEDVTGNALTWADADGNKYASTELYNKSSKATPTLTTTSDANLPTESASVYLIAVDGDSYAIVSGAPYDVTSKVFPDGSSSPGAFSVSASTSALSYTKFQSQDVPEPTSAMLLLLGVAGLALKRKQA